MRKSQREVTCKSRGLEGRTVWIVDAHGYGKPFIVRSDEILTSFLEAERAIHQSAVSLVS